MCGIVGYTGAQQAAPILLEGLKRLEYRGYDSAGIAVMKDGQISISKVTGRIDNLCEKSDNGRLLPGTAGIGHTRWATHGMPTDTNAHPHISNDGRFAIVHNGIIENYAPLRDMLTARGYHFESETDTEVIVHLIEMYYDGDMRKAVLKTASRLHGSYALGVVHADEPEKIYAVREASPLIIGAGIGENFFASDVTAIVSYTKNAIYLDDGEFAEISPDSICVFDAAGRTVNKPISRITWDIQAAEKGGYPHFMLKEIMEQPGAVNATIKPRIRDNDIELDIDIPDDYLYGVRQVMITACGSAYHAGCAATRAIETLLRVPVRVELASELRYSEPLIDERTLVIVISQSGETADTIAAMKECRRRGARVLAIVNVVGSTVAKLADYVLYTWAGPEIAVATTKGYTTQLAMLFLFALYAARRTQRVTDERFSALLTSLRMLPKRIQECFDLNPSIIRFSERYKNVGSVFFIGRGTDWAAALEAALKMKEISYIHAESYAAGELKHGTIALIEDGQSVIALCCNEAVKEKTMNNIIEVKARGAHVLAVASRGDTQVSAVADEMLIVPRVDDIFQPIVEIIPLQLLAYYTAKARGCDIDKPKNLAKSVTVE